MSAHSPLRRYASRLALLLSTLLIISALPWGPARAQELPPGLSQGTPAPETLDNSQSEFSDGRFQRTSLSSLNTSDVSPAYSTNPADVDGAVVLAPTGFLSAWGTSAVPLPVPLAGHGTVVLGNRLFVVTGTTSGDTSSDKAYWASINQSSLTGAIQPHNLPVSDPSRENDNWRRSSLPAVPIGAPDTDCGDSIFNTAGRSNAAVAGLDLGNNSGLIFVVGGRADCDVPVSSPSTQIGRVQADGTISWSTNANWNIPSAPLNDTGTGTGPFLGVARAAAVVVEAPTNTFLYVIGGEANNYDLAGEFRSQVTRAVFYTKVNRSNGTLEYPTASPPPGGNVWARAANVPLVTPAGSATFGLVGPAATAAQAIAADGTVNSAIFVSGGLYDSPLLASPRRQEFIYRATVNPNTGDLTWTANPGQPGDNVSAEGEGRYLGAMVSYNNKLYLIGGRVPAQGGGTEGTNYVQTADYNDALTLQRIPGSASAEYVIGRTNPTPVLGAGNPRWELSAAVMEALPPVPAVDESTRTAWIFATGGNNTQDELQTTIFRGAVGMASEAQDTIRAIEGWYYSDVFDVTIDNERSRLLAITWSSRIDRSLNSGADIRFEFRRAVSADFSCPDESVFEDTANPEWVALDGFPGSPYFSRSNDQNTTFNEIQLEDVFAGQRFEATCLQYRVRLLQNDVGGDGVADQPSASGRSATPQLFSVNLIKTRVGNADLRLNNLDASVSAAGRLQGMTIELLNLSVEGVDNTLTAAEATGNNGSYFVNMCVTRDAALTLPSLPVSNGVIPSCSVAFFEVFNDAIGPGGTLRLDSLGPNSPKGRIYLNNQTNPPEGITINQLYSAIFSEPGTYRVGLLIDMWNLIPEDDGVDIGEQNNRGETPPTSTSPRIIQFDLTGPPDYSLRLPFVRR